VSPLDPALWSRIVAITAIDLMLAGDNALVVALAVRTLPKRQQFLGRLWGTVAAIVLRLVFVAGVSVLMEIPFLRFAGGVAVVWIAVKLIRQAGDVETKARRGTTLGEAVWIIVVADVSMSLDNVIAIAGASHGELMLVAFGIALSVPFILWGSSLLALLMQRVASIVWLGGAILGYVAGEMIAADQIVQPFIGTLSSIVQTGLPIGLALMLFVLGWVTSGRLPLPATGRPGPSPEIERAWPENASSATIENEHIPVHADTRNG
jgi:YjbE family integral membrane protein